MKARKIGSMVTEDGDRIDVFRDEDRTVTLVTESVTRLVSADVEKLKNLLEKADSSR